MYCMHCWNALWNFNPTEMYLYHGIWALAEFLLGFNLTLVHLFFIWNHVWLSLHSFIFQFPGNHWAYLCFVDGIVNCCFKKYPVQLPNACCWALMRRISYRKNNKFSYFFNCGFVSLAFCDNPVARLMMCWISSWQTVGLKAHQNKLLCKIASPLLALRVLIFNVVLWKLINSCQKSTYTCLVWGFGQVYKIKNTSHACWIYMHAIVCMHTYKCQLSLGMTEVLIPTWKKRCSLASSKCF